MTYALGRRIEYYDQPTIREIVRRAKADNYSWSSLVLGIASSPAFTSSIVTQLLAENTIIEEAVKNAAGKDLTRRLD